MRTVHNPDGVTDSTQYGYTQAVETENELFVSGQPGWEETGEVPEGVEAQTHQAFDNLETVLANADCTLDDVTKITCYLVNPHENLETFLSVWNQRLSEPRPANTVVGVPSLALPDFKIELDPEVPLSDE
jgi:enamine deaminase RidA (YjgF/YER057c/UK114 family)